MWLFSLAWAGDVALDVVAVDFDLSADTERGVDRLVSRVAGVARSWLGVALPASMPLSVELVQTEATYRAREAPVLRGLAGHSVGFFVPARSGHRVVVWTGRGEAATRRTLVHEVTHALLAAGGRAPPWLNEGLAEAFEGATLDGNAVWLVPDAQAVAWTTAHPVQPSVLLGRSAADWDRASVGSPWTRAEYPDGWRFCAFLLSSEPGRRLLSELLLVTAVSSDPAEAASAASSWDGGLPGLDAAFARWTPTRLQLPLVVAPSSTNGWVQCSRGVLVNPAEGGRCP